MGDPPIESGKQPHFAVLTPRGRGAVATIGVRAQGVSELVGRRFQPQGGKKLADYAVGRAVYGRFQSSDAADEDVVVGILSADELEIHCHGGEAAAQAICDALVEEGGEGLTAPDWIGETTADRISAAALKTLASARTERTAAVLLDQYRGALRAAIERIERSLAEKNGAAAEEEIRRLLRWWADVGRHLTVPWKVVFAGRPNVGKSSLMNAILGYERSIVWPEPGTTRDVLVATTAIEGWRVELSDVAGLRVSGELIEREGIARAEQQIAAADLVVFVEDATAPWDDKLQRSFCHRRARGVVIAHNKWDLDGATREGRPRGVATSAVTGLGVKDLCSAMAKVLVPESPPCGLAVPFTVEQVRALDETLMELKSGNMKAAADAIGRLTTPAATG